jgi:hypothetical protein
MPVILRHAVAKELPHVYSLQTAEHFAAPGAGDYLQTAAPIW